MPLVDVKNLDLAMDPHVSSFSFFFPLLSSSFRAQLAQLLLFSTIFSPPATQPFVVATHIPPSISHQTPFVLAVAVFISGGSSALVSPSPAAASPPIGDIYVDRLDDRFKKELGDKLVMHCRGPKESAVRYNIYVAYSKRFHTIAYDAEKMTQNSEVCVSTIDGETFYGKLMEVFEIEYYDRTKYLMFRCDWANNTRDKGFKVDEYGIILVNFKNFVHTR